MSEPLPFDDFVVAIAGDPDFVALVERATERIAGVVTYRLVTVTERALSDYEPDLVVLAGYMERVSDAVLDLYTVIGFHPSLLPRYRGGSAVKWQLHLGERMVGASVYRLRPGRLDAGAIVGQRALTDPPQAVGALYRSLRAIGVELLAQAVADYARGTFTETPQDEALATWHPALRPGQSPAEYDHDQAQGAA